MTYDNAVISVALSLTGPVDEIMSLLPELSRQGFENPSANVINEDAGGGIATGQITMNGPLAAVSTLMSALAEYLRSGGASEQVVPRIQVERPDPDQRPTS